MNIGEKVRLARKKLGLTQTAFGKLLGLKQTSVSSIENNKVSMSLKSYERLKLLIKKRNLRIKL